MVRIRQPGMAGLFYPADAGSLSAGLADYTRQFDRLNLEPAGLRIKPDETRHP